LEKSMRESESFDAFYARTVRSVTNQLQSFTRDAEQTDSAVREAYARAFQQWYEVSGFRDAEGWVLDAAKDIYRRHAGAAAAEAAGGAQPAGAQPAGAHPAGAHPAGAHPAGAHPAGAHPAGAPQSGSPALSGATESDSTLRGFDGGRADYAGNGLSGGAGPTSALASPRLPTSSQRAAAQTGPEPTDLYGSPDWPGQRVASRGPRPPAPWLEANRGLVALVLAVILVAAGGGYLAFRGHGHASQGAGSHPKAKVAARAKPHMLTAGQVGTRRSIPWTLVGQGWTLAEVSRAAPNPNGGSQGGGTSYLYLVDPKGGRYLEAQWSSAPEPTVLAWSGNGALALLETASNAAGTPFSYSLLTLQSGQISDLPLPANVTAVGFTRPEGLAILAVRQGGAKYELQRYSLTGARQATIASMPHNPSQPGFESGECGSECGALSSPNGDTDVWGTRWNSMQLVGNAGGIIRRFHLTAAKKPAACAPVSWWNDTTVLADCAASQPSPDSDQLWLVPASGAAPTPLAAASGMPDGVGFDLTAMQAAGTAYVTQTSSTQCSSAASGPGGLNIEQVGSGGALSSVSIPGSQNTRNTVLAGEGSRLLVLAQTSCPGSYSLLWFYPSKGTIQRLLPASSGQLGVTAAVPFGTL
jgi:hypothetical protein